MAYLDRGYTVYLGTFFVVLSLKISEFYGREYKTAPYFRATFDANEPLFRQNHAAEVASLILALRCV